ncbi:MAG: nucleotidyltransferase domain-containing protein [Patescibacteria group bacterium]
MTSHESINRFDVGDNGEIRERLSIIQESVREIQETYPEVVGFLMFGSMVKGYATEESDIDGRIIIDVEQIHDKNSNTVTVIGWRSLKNDAGALSVKERGLSPSSIHARFEDATKKRYEDLIKDKFKLGISKLSDEQVRHIEALPISFEALDKILKIWRDNVAEFKAIEDADKKIRKKHKKEELSDEDMAFLMREKSFKLPEKNIQASEYLSQLFFLSVGSSNIRPYRAYIIKKLFSYGEIGKEMWTHIISYTEIMERRLVDEEKKEGEALSVKYPRTLEDAKYIYG